MAEFIFDAGRNQKWKKETWKKINGFDQDQIVERTGVCDNRSHLCAMASQSFQIALKIFVGIFELDTALL